VSPDFLASDFIHEHELGPLLEEAEQGGVKILWVPIRDSVYRRTPLKNYQAVLSPDTPLAAMTEAKRDQAWVRICVEIEKAVKRLEAEKGYDARPGWDACTGLGTPAGTAILSILCREAEAKERLEPERREVPAPVSEASQPIDRVNFSVFAPGVIRPAQQFLLDLWVHLPTQSDEVTSLTREFARERRLGVKPQVTVTHGAALSVVLDLPSLRIKDPSHTIFWNGEPDYASFIVEVPADVAVGGHPGQAIITASGMPIAKVTFCLPIESTSTNTSRPWQTFVMPCTRPRTSLRSRPEKEAKAKCG